MSRYSKYSLQCALDLTDGFCRYLVQDRHWGPQEILDAEAVVFDFESDAEQMLWGCIAYGDPATIGRLRYFLAEDCRVHFVRKMDDHRVVTETARQFTQYGYQVVIEPGLGWAVQVDAASAAPLVPVAVEPEPEVDGALAELKVVLGELVAEQRKKYDQYETKLAGLSDAEKAALYGKKAGEGLWDATIGGAVGLVKALPDYAAGYFKTLCKIAMLPNQLANATAQAITMGDMAPLKAEADKYVQPLVKTYDQAVHYKGVLVVLFEDEQTMGVLNDFAQNYWDATHPLERTEMGASAAADIVVTVLLALITSGIGAAANIAAKSKRLEKAAELLEKIAGMLKRIGHRHKMPKKERPGAGAVADAGKKSGKVAKGGMPEPETPKAKAGEGVEKTPNKVDDGPKKETKENYNNKPPTKEDISLAKSPGKSVEQVSARSNVASRFYEKQGFDPDTIPAHLEGVDLNQPVEVVTLEEGTKLKQMQIPGAPQGNYYTNPDTPTDTLGVSLEAIHRDTGAIIERVEGGYIVTKDTEALGSTAADILDNWSIPGKVISTKGGGAQYFSTDTISIVPVE